MSKISPTTMKAWTHTRTGFPSDILTLSTVPIPQISSPLQVLIKISHCALNPAGSIVMQLLPFMFRRSPAIPEMDFSGIIIEMGSAVPINRNLSPSTRVFGSIPLNQHVKQTSGALAEYVVVDHTAIVRKPDMIQLKAVAGLGIAGSTAVELIKAAKLKDGDRVFVNAASGGIGHLVAQMCRNEVGPDGDVLAVCSTDNVEWVQKYDSWEYAHRAPDHVLRRPQRFQVIDYEQHAPLVSYLTETYAKDKFDVVIDAVGIQEVFNKSPGFLKEGGVYVTVGPKACAYSYTSMLGTLWSMAKNMLWPRVLGGTPRPYVQVAATSNLQALTRMASTVEQWKLRVHVGTLVKMEDVQKAYEQMLSGHARGKVVVQVGEDAMLEKGWRPSTGHSSISGPARKA